MEPKIVSNLAGIDEREPYPSELEWFQSNPTVPGMAAEDNRVIMNPFFKFESDQARNSVRMNETARAFMRAKNIRPNFYLSPSQAGQFRNYSPNEQDIKETLVARALSGDPSAGGFLLPEQRMFINKLRRMMFPEQK